MIHYNTYEFFQTIDNSCSKEIKIIVAPLNKCNRDVLRDSELNISSNSDDCYCIEESDNNVITENCYNKAELFNVLHDNYYDDVKCFQKIFNDNSFLCDAEYKQNICSKNINKYMYQNNNELSDFTKKIWEYCGYNSDKIIPDCQNYLKSKENKIYQTLFNKSSEKVCDNQQYFDINEEKCLYHPPDKIIMDTYKISQDSLDNISRYYI